MAATIIAILLPALLAVACNGRRAAESPAPAVAAPSPAARPSPAASAEGPLVLFLGTSLTAGLGLAPEQAYPALVEQRIRAAGLPHRVVNAGLSGETSAGARRRLDWLLGQHRVAVLVVETGANDALRGQEPEATRANIQAIIERARRQSPPPLVVLLGMKALPNYGAYYARRFEAVYTELAARNGTPLVPFLLEGVGGVAALNQADGVHPTTEGHRVMAETVWRVLEPLVAQRRK